MGVFALENGVVALETVMVLYYEEGVFALETGVFALVTGVFAEHDLCGEGGAFALQRLGERLQPLVLEEQPSLQSNRGRVSGGACWRDDARRNGEA